MIAAGIAFEILFSMLVSGREKVISSIAAQRRIEAEQKTAEALGKLKAADGHIAELTLQAEQERTARREIEERIVKANEAIARARVFSYFLGG